MRSLLRVQNSFSYSVIIFWYSFNCSGHPRFENMMPKSASLIFQLASQKSITWDFCSSCIMTFLKWKSPWIKTGFFGISSVFSFRALMQIIILSRSHGGKYSDPAMKCSKRSIWDMKSGNFLCHGVRSFQKNISPFGLTACMRHNWCVMFCRCSSLRVWDSWYSSSVIHGMNSWVSQKYGFPVAVIHFPCCRVSGTRPGAYWLISISVLPASNKSSFIQTLRTIFCHPVSIIKICWAVMPPGREI